VVKIDGSSTVFPMTEAVAEDFQKAKKGRQGHRGHLRHGRRLQEVLPRRDRHLQRLAPDLGRKWPTARIGVEYIELPVAFDALTVVINPKNTWLKQATVAELKKMWEPAAQGKITRWNQVNPAWPDAPIKLFGAGSDSGTFDYFTEAIVGKSKSSRGDFTASEDDNVLVQGVSLGRQRDRLLRLRLLRREPGKLKALPIVEKDGKPAVSPSEQTVLAGTYQPLARPIFIYVNAKSLAKPEVKKFVEYYMNPGRQDRQGSEVRAAARQGLQDGPGAHCQGQEGHRVRRQE
jgi:phosphate transport system substrate-binding protein